MRFSFFVDLVKYKWEYDGESHLKDRSQIELFGIKIYSNNLIKYNNVYVISYISDLSNC